MSLSSTEKPSHGRPISVEKWVGPVVIQEAEGQGLVGAWGEGEGGQEGL